MPNIELPIRSLSILFLLGAIVAILWFPDNPSSPNLSRALFWWFLALGVVRWVENGLFYLLPKVDGAVSGNWEWVAYLIAIVAFGVHVWFLIRGALYFYAVLSNL